MRCIAGIDPLTQDNIYLDSTNIIQLPLSKRNIGMIFQQYSLFLTKTVFDNIAYGMRIKKQPKVEKRDKVSHALEIVPLSGPEDKYFVNMF